MKKQVERLRLGEYNDFDADIHIQALIKHIDTLKLSLSGKTNFDEVAELKRQVKSQDEITDVLHIVNAELGRRVESQKEEIAKYQELIYQVASKFPDESRHETALRYIKRAEEASDCCAGEDQLPKEE